MEVSAASGRNQSRAPELRRGGRSESDLLLPLHSTCVQWQNWHDRKRWPGNSHRPIDERSRRLGAVRRWMPMPMLWLRRVRGSLLARPALLGCSTQRLLESSGSNWPARSAKAGAALQTAASKWPHDSSVYDKPWTPVQSQVTVPPSRDLGRHGVPGARLC